MANILNLPYKRFVRQVSNGMARTKYSYQAMQQDLLVALKQSIWKEANCSTQAVTTVVNKVSQTDGVVGEDGTVQKQPTYTAFIDDRYDAYKQGGDANTSNATFCGYAGMVAYRFVLPTGQTSNISEATIHIQASRYLRSGLRVAIVLSNEESPSTDWEVIRGDNDGAIVSNHTEPEEGVVGVSSWGVLGQNVYTLMESMSQETKLIFKATDFPALGTTTRYTYMWVYMSIEDYTDYWNMYDSATPRYYSIEGSATIVGSACLVSFAAEEQIQQMSHTMSILKDGVLPSNYKKVSSEGVESIDAQAYQVTVQRNGDKILTGDLQMVVDDILSQGHTVNKVEVLPPLGTSTAEMGVVQFATICGKGFKGTFKDIDGLLLYDIEKKQIVNYNDQSISLDAQSKIDLYDFDTYDGICKCLMNYEPGVGFYFLPFLKKKETTYTMFDEVKGVYANGWMSGSLPFFSYNKSTCTISNLRVAQHTELMLYSSRQCIGVPSMIQTSITGDGGSVVCIWVGAVQEVDEVVSIESLLMTTKADGGRWRNVRCSFEISHMTDSEGHQTGLIYDIVSVPKSWYKEPNSQGTDYQYRYKALFGVVAVGGGLYTSGGNISREEGTSYAWANSIQLFAITNTATQSVSYIRARKSLMQNTGVALEAGITVNVPMQSVKDNVVADPVRKSGLTTVGWEEWIICGIGANAPIKFASDGQPYAMAYDASARDITELANGDAVWRVTDKAGFSAVKFGEYMVLDETTQFTQAQSQEGLRYCYGRYFVGDSTKISGMSKRIGAACTLNNQFKVGLTRVGDTGISQATIDGWQLITSALVVPFACPRTWKAKQVKLDWTGWSNATGGKVRVWLLREQFLSTNPEYLNSYDIMTGGTVTGCELIGEIDPTTGTKTATFDIQEMSSRVATIIITAFLDHDDINPTNTTQFPQGVGSLKLNMKTNTLEGTETAFMPDISLKG